MNHPRAAASALALAALVALGTTACGTQGPPPSGAAASAGSSSPTGAGARTEPLTLAPGLLLEPGADGRLPVRVRWVRRLDSPEEVAVHGTAVYVAGTTVQSFRLRDGHLRWEVATTPAEGLYSDDVVIGLDGPGQIRAWAQYRYDLTVAVTSGRQLRHDEALGVPPRSLRALRRVPPAVVRVRIGDPRELVARDPEGRVAWRITVTRPTGRTRPALAIPGGLVVLTSNGYLVALDTPGD